MEATMTKQKPKYQLYYKGHYYNTQQLNEVLAKEEAEKRAKKESSR